MSNYQRAYASINLDALRHNMRSMIAHTPSGLSYAGVIKVDGYGHGAVPVAKAIDAYVSFFCVATVDEAVNLCKHHIQKPILILGPVPGDDYHEVIAYNIRSTVFTLEQARALSMEAVRQNCTAKLHIALDTGMNRIGMKPTEESIALIKEILALPNLDAEGIFTHLYSADEANKQSALEQIQLFRFFLDRLKEEGINPPIRHVSNSAGIIEHLGTDFDMVRAGIILYGIRPSEEVIMDAVDILPVMELHSTITYIKEIKAGEAVSYGATFVAKDRMRVATIPIGYGDGYPRSLSNVGYVLIEGKRAQILGRICMDQMMVDVSDIASAKIGSDVTLIGKNGSDQIKVEDLSALCTRFPYEFVCDITRRVPRIYVDGGRIVSVKDYFYDEYKGFL